MTPEVGRGQTGAQRGAASPPSIHRSIPGDSDRHGMTDAVRLCRVRAEACEQRARATTDPTLRREWEELGIQWHLVANVAAQMAGEHGVLREEG